MTKSILISVRPEHLLNILNGTKTLELRKSVPKDFIGWVYIYCTKGRKDILHKHKDKYYTNHYLTFTDSAEVLNSKVVARFWFDDYDTYYHDNHGVDLYTDIAEYNVMYDDLDKLCLDYREIEHYGKGKELYAWHIKQLEIFDTPLSLSEFYRKVEFRWADTGYMNFGGEPIEYHELEKAPQSWQYIYTKRSC